MKPDYVMVKKLGGGAFGTVYLIRSKESLQLLAAKHQKVKQEKDMRYMRREVEILDLLDIHDNPDIVSLAGYYESPLESVILTEYLEGGELFDRIASRDFDLTEDKCRGFMRQVLTGLSYIHQRGVIHLDLKPNNIVCVTRDEGDSRVKIIDFGLARRLRNAGERIPVSVCGTPEFISPEVMRCSEAGTEADMWSTGVIVFMMVTGGYSPFYSRNKVNILNFGGKHINKRSFFCQYKMMRRAINGNYNIEQFPRVSRDAKEMVRSLIVVSPDQRLSADECLGHPWLEAGSLRLEAGDNIRRLETEAMRRWLARRRWARVGALVRATVRMKIIAPGPGYFSQEEEVWL